MKSIYSGKQTTQSMEGKKLTMLQRCAVAKPNNYLMKSKIYHLRHKAFFNTSYCCNNNNKTLIVEDKDLV